MDAHIGGVEGRVEALSEGVEVALRVASVKCKIQVLNRSKSKIYRREILDRLLHHAETCVIEGKSYRMKDQLEA